MDQRIRYQMAIEQVYWRHRIWPKENPQPKPPLEQVLPLSAIEAKVHNYLIKSHTIEVNWRRPITEELLRTETARMAGETRRPEMLQELWAALHNDPYVIGECLARASLVNRILGEGRPSKDMYEAAVSQWPEVGPRAYNAPSKSETYKQLAWSGSQSPSTTAMAAAPQARYTHTAVWTGSEMIIWGGSDRTSSFNTGARYDPATDTWTPTSTANAPSARNTHSAVWTGREMIVWGGVSDPSSVGTGGRYDPATDTWQATSTVSAPTSRRDHTAVWTGTEMIIWGGVDPTGTDITYQTGGRYDPTTDTWRATSVDGVPSERALHTAVWTGKEMIVWGGIDLWTYFRSVDAASYDPATDTWTAISTVNAPSPRVWHAAVWTGSEMVVWGGGFAEGGRYNPASDTWTATSTANAPDIRYFATAVWSGSKMLVWGGFNYSGFGLVYYNSGGRYDPIADAWTATDATGAPSARYNHSAVWSGSEMVVWGGYDGVAADNDGGHYDPATDTWVPTATGISNSILQRRLVQSP